MHAAEAAGRHEPNAHVTAHRERPADGRRARRALRNGGGEVARPELACRPVEALQLALVEADDDLAVEDADRGRDRAALANGRLRGEADADTLARREAVRDERRLQGHDPAPEAECPGYLRRAPYHGSAPMWAQQRAAASTTRPGPPTRKPAASAAPAPVASTTSVSTAA